MFKKILIVYLLVSGCQLAAEQSLLGHYEGWFEYKGKKLIAIVDFEYSNGKQLALLSIPENLQLKKPFTTVEYYAPNLELQMSDGDTPMIIHATLDQNNIDGKLNGNVPAAIHLTKIENYTPPAKKYTVETITLKNNEIKLAANLYLPKVNNSRAAVIMIAGSGNHIKEEYNGGADLFASNGIAVLTFDKRNVTSVRGIKLKQVNSDIASMKDLVGDAEAAFNLLKTDKRIDPNKIGVIGFSLGAVEVPVVAANHPDIAFVIAVSGNVTTDKEFIINQGLNKYREKGYDAQTIKKAETLYNDLFRYAKTRSHAAVLQSELDKSYAEKWGQLCFSPQVPGEDELKYLMTWNNFEFDPAAYWEKIHVPTLVIYGEKDTYIPVERSIKILHKVFDTKKELLTLREYSGADHTIRTIAGKENFDFPKYADNYINDLLSWLLKQSK